MDEQLHRSSAAKKAKILRITSSLSHSTSRPQKEKCERWTRCALFPGCFHSIILHYFHQIWMHLIGPVRFDRCLEHTVIKLCGKVQHRPLARKSCMLDVHVFLVRILRISYALFVRLILRVCWKYFVLIERLLGEPIKHHLNGMDMIEWMRSAPSPFALRQASCTRWVRAHLARPSFCAIYWHVDWFLLFARRSCYIFLRFRHDFADTATQPRRETASGNEKGEATQKMDAEKINRDNYDIHFSF